MSIPIRTCFWFGGNGLEAAEFYVSLLPDSRIEHVFRPAPEAPPLVIGFSLAGVPYQILNAEPRFTHSEAVSIVVTTPDQAETDRLWEAITANGGSASQCGWCKDRFGVSWQIIPEALPGLLSHPDADARQRVFTAMLAMQKIDVAMLEAAARG